MLLTDTMGMEVLEITSGLAEAGTWLETREGVITAGGDGTTGVVVEVGLTDDCDLYGGAAATVVAAGMFGRESSRTSDVCAVLECTAQLVRSAANTNRRERTKQ
jgi:hypothetical protein